MIGFRVLFPIISTPLPGDIDLKQRVAVLWGQHTQNTLTEGRLV